MIRIGIDPNLVDTGSFILSWHGLLTFVAVTTAVVLVARWSRREKGIVSDDVYAVSVWAVIGGIIGARLVHVIDRWEVYGENLAKIFTVWEGGIALYGAILFGFVGGASYIWGRQLLGRIYYGEVLPWFKSLDAKPLIERLDKINEKQQKEALSKLGFFQRMAVGYLRGDMYARFKGFSVGRLADLTAPALLIAQTIGRIGDIINGEHLSTRTERAWGFIYSHPSSGSYQEYGLNASHPVIAYEMIWNMLVLAVLWKLRGRLAPPGMLFATYLLLYSLGRFFIQFLRLDKEWFAGLQEAHVIALTVMIVTVPLLAYRARWVRPEAAPASQGRPKRSRARS